MNTERLSGRTTMVDENKPQNTVDTSCVKVSSIGAVPAETEELEQEVREMLDILQTDAKWYRQSSIIRPEDLRRRITL